jgi:hypothetical protein
LVLSAWSVTDDRAYCYKMLSNKCNARI